MLTKRRRLISRRMKGQKERHSPGVHDSMIKGKIRKMNHLRALLEGGDLRNLKFRFGTFGLSSGWLRWIKHVCCLVTEFPDFIHHQVIMTSLTFVQARAV